MYKVFLSLKNSGKKARSARLHMLSQHLMLFLDLKTFVTSILRIDYLDLITSQIN